MTTPTNVDKVPYTLRVSDPDRIIRDSAGKAIGIRYYVGRDSEAQRLGWSIRGALQDGLLVECVAVGSVAGDAAQAGVTRAVELSEEAGFRVGQERTMAEESRPDGPRGWAGVRPVVRIKVWRIAEEDEGRAGQR